MKKLFLILIVGFALVMAHDLNGVYAGDDGDGGRGIPQSKLAGKVAQTAQGSITVCFKPDFSATENCSTPGVQAVPANIVLVGQGTGDRDGDSCATATFTQGFSGAPSAPFVGVQVTVGKVTKYDPATGSGDVSVTNYSGGKCEGSKFDSTGATVINTATAHFVASDNGERVDAVTTSITDSLGDIGAFNLASVALKQKD